MLAVRVRLTGEKRIELRDTNYERWIVYRSG